MCARSEGSVESARSPKLYKLRKAIVMHACAAAQLENKPIESLLLAFTYVRTMYVQEVKAQSSVSCTHMREDTNFMNKL